MSRNMAEALIPKRIDAVKLVKVNQSFNAAIDQNNLTRLNEAVVRCLEPVTCEVEFLQAADKQRLMRGKCHTSVVMNCQRCLGEVTYPIDSEFEIGLVFNDEQASQLPRTLEPVELDENGQLDLWTVLEDEVLLALPMFPMHAENECQAEVITVSEPEAETTNSSDERPNPFAALAKLKQ